MCAPPDQQLGPDRVDIRCCRLPDNQRTEPLLRLIRIVRAATKLEIGRVGASALGEGDDVVELQETTFGAASGRANEGAAALVARPDCPLHRSRHVARGGWRSAGRSGTLRDRELLFLEIPDEQCQRPLEDRRGISIRDGVSQQCLGAEQVAVGFARDGDLHPVALGRERRHDWRTSG